MKIGCKKGAPPHSSTPQLPNFKLEILQIHGSEEQVQLRLAASISRSLLMNFSNYSDVRRKPAATRLQRATGRRPRRETSRFSRKLHGSEETDQGRREAEQTRPLGRSQLQLVTSRTSVVQLVPGSQTSVRKIKTPIRSELSWTEKKAQQLISGSVF